MILKVALCIPAYGMVHAKWTQCLTDMIVYTLTEARITDQDGQPITVEFNTFMVSSSNLCESRHRLCAEASLWGADYMLFLDADHVFAKESFCRLWSRNVDIVGVNYSRRCIPTAPTAAKIVTDDKDKDHNNLVYTTEDKGEGNLLEEVSHLGFGMVLMKMSIFDRLQAQAEKEGRASMMPLFLFGLREDGMSPIGEDVHFFQKCREAGIKVHCDHGVSWMVGHVHEFIMMNAHAVMQEEDWLEQQKEFVTRLREKAATLDGWEAPAPRLEGMAA